ncbi:MAG: hypothetical protein UT20_C0019G0009 [Candidatus Levybacteria bacterium GW2011_GWA1_39_11]|nr:MAG: hypothetical protein UT20_C0019G0009 [Candidatus Levybacteria bacterium GW2011_GWA1_39_11]KKR27511.1 MAG: hypothetical protein UT57_C0003G0025 [Microgenomates group bacterium GW2011_GWC1_39_7]
MAMRPKMRKRLDKSRFFVIAFELGGGPAQRDITISKLEISLRACNGGE